MQTNIVDEIRNKFLDFYRRRGHAVIPSSSLLPENDASTLFTSSGMQPLLPYFLGTTHPEGRRIADAQKCFRAVDIDEVGDNRHTTFFEMLGNWSFGDYFKKEQIPAVFAFFTQVLGLDPARLYVTVFAGDTQIGLAEDDESIKIWQEVFATKGIEARVGERIFAYGPEKNWWSRSGTPEKMPAGEPGGSDSEIFYDFGEALELHEHSAWASQKCHPNCDCGRFIEIGNSVFMQFQKTADGKFVDLPAKNVDYGGGLERALMAVQDKPDVFTTSVFTPMISVLEIASGQKYQTLDDKTRRAWRIIADHTRSAIFLISEGLEPANKGQGYVLRRLLRRSLVQLHRLGLANDLLSQFVEPLSKLYTHQYSELSAKSSSIQAVITKESRKFAATLDKGLKQIAKLSAIDGEKAFFLYESYGFPFELTREIAAERGLSLDEQAFKAAQDKHREQSRTASAGTFRGGLADHTTQTVHFHTATHLLLAALRAHIDPAITQKGSNITGERARFDFTLQRALTSEEIQTLQDQVNAWIKADLPVTKAILPKQQALTLVGGSVFAERYPDQVSVYTIGDAASPASREICVGPHVEHTGQIPQIVLRKQQSAGSGVRRLYLYPAAA